MQESSDNLRPRQTSGWRQKILQRKRTWLFWVALVVAFLALLFYNALYPPPVPLTNAQVNEIVVQAMASATPAPAYSTAVYEIILPSLVTIQTERVNSGNAPDFSIGSGVIANNRADILTAFHVVAGAEQIEVVFADGTRTTAVIAAAAPENDIAVLQAAVLPELIVPAVLGNPNAMQIGDEAYAVGTPLGLAGSLSAGVISGFDRSIPLNDAGDELAGLIQFDAAVNPGNSGGPLLNRAGQVIGIVTALANPANQDFFTGIGFAVPITTAGSTAGAPPY